MVERLIVTTQSPVIGPEAVSRALGNSFSPSADAPLPPLAPQSLPQAVEELEERMLREALQSYHTTRRIGEALGIDQSTVSKKLKNTVLPPIGKTAPCTSCIFLHKKALPHNGRAFYYLL